MEALGSGGGGCEGQELVPRLRARGDTVQNVFKPATTHKGYEIQVPMFVNIGDRIRIDTRTGEYADRVSKK